MATLFSAIIWFLWKCFWRWDVAVRGTGHRALGVFPGKLWNNRKEGGGRRGGSGQRRLAVQALAAPAHPGNLPSVAVSAL